MPEQHGIYPGGLTVLEMSGFADFQSLRGQSAVHLYGPHQPPSWVYKFAAEYLPNLTFDWHGRKELGGGLLSGTVYSVDAVGITGDTFDRLAWGPDEWSLTASSVERAAFEMLADIPASLSFEHADQIFRGLERLSPGLIEKLLAACDSVKLKRLFLWFSERHKHRWLSHLDLARYNMTTGALGVGKRKLVKGGRLDPKYLITVPAEFYR